MVEIRFNCSAFNIHFSESSHSALTFNLHFYLPLPRIGFAGSNARKNKMSMRKKPYYKWYTSWRLIHGLSNSHYHAEKSSYEANAWVKTYFRLREVKRIARSLWHTHVTNCITTRYMYCVPFDAAFLSFAFFSAFFLSIHRSYCNVNQRIKNLFIPFDITFLWMFRCALRSSFCSLISHKMSIYLTRNWVINRWLLRWIKILMKMTNEMHNKMGAYQTNTFRRFVVVPTTFPCKHFNAYSLYSYTFI